MLKVHVPRKNGAKQKKKQNNNNNKIQFSWDFPFNCTPPSICFRMGMSVVLSEH